MTWESDVKKHNNAEQQHSKNQQNCRPQKTKKLPQSSQDSAWKEVIKEYFPPFIQFYFPLKAARTAPGRR